jgi:hypothetical protein
MTVLVYVFHFLSPDFRPGVTDAAVAKVISIRDPRIELGASQGEYLPRRGARNANYLRARDRALRFESIAPFEFDDYRADGTNVSFRFNTNGADARVELH